MCFCDLDLIQERTEYECKCDAFEDSGYVFDKEDYNKRMQAIADERKRFKEMLDNDPEFKKLYDEMVEEVWSKLLYGEVKEEKEKSDE